ncbi:MAG: hypothetical protein UX81_C0007G0007 [Parcubacteria group bacterium GW2011_GWA2_47_12]|nr:MAG: hypothetical protein UX81_C0007G0007 [Parcubacteria group bacterium GW2011_GWA2_47_12]
MTMHAKNGVPRGLSGYLITVGGKEKISKTYKKKIRELDSAFKHLKGSLENQKLDSLNWHDELYQKMAEMTVKMDEVKKELAVHLNADEKAVRKYIVSVVTNENHKLNLKYFQDSGSDEYNEAAGKAIVWLVCQGNLGVDLEFKLYLGKYKLPE